MQNEITEGMLAAEGQAEVMELIRKLGLELNYGSVAMADLDRANRCYIHHTEAPVAVAGYAMVSVPMARGRFPGWTFIQLIQKRHAMDEREAVALAAVCGIDVEPPFWGNPAPFGKFLWSVIARYQMEPFFERLDPSKGYGSGGEHYLMRPRGINPETDELDLALLTKWRADFRKLETARQLMVATVLQLYRQGEDKNWMVRVPKTWLAADGIEELRKAGFLKDWAKLYALYPGW